MDRQQEINLIVSRFICSILCGESGTTTEAGGDPAAVGE